jgi:hypothetical protein
VLAPAVVEVAVRTDDPHPVPDHAVEPATGPSRCEAGRLRREVPAPGGVEQPAVVGDERGDRLAEDDLGGGEVDRVVFDLADQGRRSATGARSNGTCGSAWYQ